MSGFIADNSSYNISTDYSMATILSHFNTEYIYATIKDWIDIKYREPMLRINNIVYGYQENFKQLLYTYTAEEDRTQILNTRNSVYTDIIDLLCKEFNLEYNVELQDGQDLFTPAFYLFRLLVSEFTENVKRFFVNYIIREKNGIYAQLNMEQFKKQKDSSTMYNRKRIRNSKLAIIISRLNYVIDSICVGYDIPFGMYLSYICDDPNLYNYLINLVAPRNDFFKTYVAPMLSEDSHVRASLISDITIELAKQCNSDVSINDYMEEDDE